MRDPTQSRVQTRTMRTQARRLPARPRSNSKVVGALASTKIDSHPYNSNSTLTSNTNTDQNADTNQLLPRTLAFRKVIPPEIQLAIFKLVVACPRIIRVVFDKNDVRKRKHRFTNAIPHLLHFSKEARNFALPLYTVNPFQHPKATNGCFFNYNIDILYFDDHTTIQHTTNFVEDQIIKTNLHNVKHVAFGFFSLMKEIEIVPTRFTFRPTPSLAHFGALQTVVVPMQLDHPLRKKCPHCGGGVMKRSEERAYDDVKNAASELAGNLREGRTYTAPFGDHWQDPKWEFKTYCMRLDWQERHVEDLLERIEVAEREKKHGVKVGASKTSGSSSSGAESKSAESKSTKSKSAESTRAEGERAESESATETAMESSLDGGEGETPPTSPEK